MDSCLLLAVREQHISCMGESKYLQVAWKASGDRAHTNTPHCLPSSISRCLNPAQLQTEKQIKHTPRKLHLPSHSEQQPAPCWS